MDTTADRHGLIGSTASTAAVDPMEPVPHRVVDRVAEGPGIVTLRVEPVEGSLPVALPGQFMMLWVFGVGEVPISLSGATPDGSLFFTVQAVGSTSTAIVNLNVGDLLGLRGPFGTPWPLEAAMGREVLIMAGGLGLAPLRMAIDSLCGDDEAAGRLTVLVGARQPANLLFSDDAVRWSSHGAKVRTTVDAADRTWGGAVGVITTLLDREPWHADVAFVCGPEAMMVASVRSLIKGGMKPEDIHVSLERNMHCGIAHCGRCQLGPLLLCRDGAVVRWDRVADLLAVRGR